MAGTIYASVDHLIGNTGSLQNNYQEYFITVYNFLNTHWTRIACNFGTASGTLDAGGLNYWDAANDHAGEEAWAVFRTNGNGLPAYNVVISWASTGWSTWSVVDSTSSANDRVGIGPALLDTGDDAWNGTTNNDGTDTAGAPRWTIGGASTLFTFNFYNESGGARSTNKEDLLQICNAGFSGQGLLNMWIDDDSLFIIYDDNLDGGVTGLFFGKYISLSYIENSLPIIGINDNNYLGAWQLGGTGGSLYGSTNQEGGALLPLIGTGPAFHFEHFSNTYFTNYQPNLQADGYFESSFWGIISRGTSLGLIGYVDPRFVKYSSSQPFNSVGKDGNATVAYFGAGGTNDRFVVPWHSNGPPGTNSTRAGYQFTVEEE